MLTYQLRNHTIKKEMLGEVDPSPITQRPTIFRRLAQNYYNEFFFDSLSLLNCLTYISMMFNNLKAFHILWHIHKHGAELVVSALLIWFIFIFGLTCSNMALYSGESLVHNSLLSAFTDTI